MFTGPTGTVEVSEHCALLTEMTKDLNTALLVGLLKTKPFRDRIFFLLLSGRKNGDPTL